MGGVGVIGTGDNPRNSKIPPAARMAETATTMRNTLISGLKSWNIFWYYVFGTIVPFVLLTSSEFFEVWQRDATESDLVDIIVLFDRELW